MDMTTRNYRSTCQGEKAADNNGMVTFGVTLRSFSSGDLRSPCRLGLELALRSCCWLNVERGISFHNVPSYVGGELVDLLVLGQLLRENGVHFELRGDLAVLQESEELLDSESLLALEVVEDFLLEVLV